MSFIKVDEYLMGRIKKLGPWAEHIAWLNLQAHQFQLLAKNFHSRYGEIDLIVQKDQLILFIEVKARSTMKYGQAHEMISTSKQQKIIKTAMVFLQENEQYQDYDLRFDVICIQMKQSVSKNIQQDFSSLNYDLTWIEHAFML